MIRIEDDRKEIKDEIQGILRELSAKNRSKEKRKAARQRMFHTGKTRDPIKLLYMVL